MKEKPILMSAPMINAILEGRKSQTRRVINPSIPTTHRSWNNHGDDDLFFWTDHPTQGEKGDVIYRRCPYGARCDRLWVRETFAYIWPDIDPVPLRECTIEYRADTSADYPGGWGADEARGNDDAPKWRPSIFMPRWASRITLEITDVRVERVQDISDDDAIEEGVDRTNTSIPTYARQRFQKTLGQHQCQARQRLGQ